eukprot:CAMPEP_0185617256 /NCGR_PEP_ID=MMETSP0436-20130131/42900_1 /TAXON_ID=626734 ORGANISM="Favella taraikaensis, Strain Fe Narragansett Bay" /NCGR_SAMPLE_ID=MMETSP0436 /ASSEMBLY_ACC=CAM_ASM_000390 /LENGTH=40 /DNA_ID= /DNA_START= /DNA_END= /DNA_ORIENTATION=
MTLGVGDADLLLIVLEFAIAVRVENPVTAHDGLAHREERD